MSLRPMHGPELNRARGMGIFACSTSMAIIYAAVNWFVWSRSLNTTFHMAGNLVHGKACVYQERMLLPYERHPDA